MAEENKGLLDKAKEINWRSKSTIIALSSSVLGLILLGIGQFFTLQQKPDASFIDYFTSIALFTFVIIAVPSAFSELGKVMGFASEEIKKPLEENNEHFEEIGKKNWERSLEQENELDNIREKLRMLKIDTLNKLAKDPSNKELQDLKSNVLSYYEYLDTDNEDRKLELKTELDNNNFDIDMYNVAYEHIDYNDLFGIQSSSLSKRVRKLNINKVLLKQAMIKRTLIILVGGYASAYGLLFGFSLLSLLMFLYQIALVAWTSFTTYNSAYGLVINELKQIIENNNTFLKICLKKFVDRDEYEKTRPKTPEEIEDEERKAEEKTEREELKALADAERKFEREFKIEERKMKHQVKMAEIQAKSELAQATMKASITNEVKPTPKDTTETTTNPQKVIVEVRSENKEIK